MSISPPFRADHVGSLLRPRPVLEARDALAGGRIDAARLREVEDMAIRELIRRQEAIGLQAVTDGEIRRGSWHMDFIYQIGGIREGTTSLQRPFRNAKGEVSFSVPIPEIIERLKLEKTIFEKDFQFVQANTKALAKLTIPSPSMVHRMGTSFKEHPIYADLDKFWDDIVAVYADEIDRLGKLGCTYLQIDDTTLATVNDPKERARIRELGLDPEHAHEKYIEVLNRAIAKRPPGMFISTHTCRGNHQSSWVATGGYDFVAQTLFEKLNVDSFFLEYDNERSGGFEPLRFVPKNKVVVLGLVTTKYGAIEKKDDLKRRIDQASKFIPLDQLCLSPQCGFASTLRGNDLSHEEQFAKLQLVVETAREVWG